ncbi:MAG: hypothetical protein HQK57_13155 [Deltaproteobacteria bacterium]|nr:hypothetical protein [Deltaproteobacteria bacterium]
MSIELLAYFDLDGSAIVKIDFELLLVRPPFEKRHTIKINETMLDKAVLRFGFFSTEKMFPDWETLIQFLNAQVAEAHKARGVDLSKVDVSQDIIDLAPPEILDRYLDRIERELIPARRFDHAESVLMAMIKSDNPDLSSKPRRLRVTQLIQALSEARKSDPVKALQSMADESRFPNLTKHGGLAKARKIEIGIREQQSMLAHAA